MPFTRHKVLTIKLLAEFGMKAIESQRGPRLVIQGFSKRDIIEFLPVRSLVPGGANWDELYKDWVEVRAKAPDRLDFKDWLRQSKGASISTSTITAAAHDLDAVPEEIVNVLRACQLAAGQAQSGGTASTII